MGRAMPMCCLLVISRAATKWRTLTASKLYDCFVFVWDTCIRFLTDSLDRGSYGMQIYKSARSISPNAQSMQAPIKLPSTYHIINWRHPSDHSIIDRAQRSVTHSRWAVCRHFCALNICVLLLHVKLHSQDSEWLGAEHAFGLAKQIALQTKSQQIFGMRATTTNFIQWQIPLDDFQIFAYNINSFACDCCRYLAVTLCLCTVHPPFNFPNRHFTASPCSSVIPSSLSARAWADAPSQLLFKTLLLGIADVCVHRCRLCQSNNTTRACVCVRLWITFRFHFIKHFIGALLSISNLFPAFFGKYSLWAFLNFYTGPCTNNTNTSRVLFIFDEHTYTHSHVIKSHT